MKKMRLFGLLMAMIMGLGFTSCEEDEVSISILIDGTVPEEVAVGETLAFNYSVTIDNNKLESVEILQNYELYDFINEFSSDLTYNGTFSFTAYEDNIGTQNFAFEVTDNKGNTETRAFTFEVVSAAGEINSYEAKLLGSYTASAGSFYSSTNNTVYSQADAKANYELIDFVYFYGNTGFATIAAPNHDGAISVYNNATNGLATWTARNATKFKITLLGQTEFDGIEDDALIVAEENISNSSASQLAEGDVVAFTTVDDKQGLFLVKEVTGTGGASTITIQVKVQQ
ncbi:hypothetical protein [Geofilum rubicundum]|uniref:Uncharacterized protein n=1 Tax=Geofilum rubicundum JCM 15548 TaxID=1236989 RepID=A0A0E9LW88_9BACT|nr:hypothetical protein [Geofilum rubicundum]GAO29504.1 hypothetical protein JCM15548_11696 [Geofilum rubicundum JCM 15548]